MRINSLLNDSPSDSPATDSDIPPTSDSRNPVHVPVHSPSNPLISSHQQYPHFKQAADVYHGFTASSRSSYSGLSTHPSIGATSPLETSTTQQHNDNVSWFGGKAVIPDITPTPGSGRVLQQQTPCLPRVLPSLTSVVSMPQPKATMTPIAEGTPSGQSGHQQASNGYFGVASYATQYTRPKNYYQQQFHPPAHNPYTPQGQLAPSGGSADPLMRFANVAAMESARLGGRRNLEDVATAEVLTGQRSSMGGSIEGANVQPERRNPNMHIDPQLRPGVRSTQKSTSPTQEDAPLFRPSPEPTIQSESTVETTTSASAGFPSEDHVVSAYEFLSEVPKCSYCNVCTTGSPLRKVVSHIFGRNKLSTRQIPKNVWVYYCRKHYQRSRYRNPRGFARQQVLLVRRQCQRLEEWGGVKQWVIKVRRREELRMNREGDNVEEIEDMADENEEAIDDGEMESNELMSGGSRQSSNATARRRSSGGSGSNWIKKHTGTEKTIQDVYRLLEKIEVEVQQNGGKFPDVELLPNVDLSLAVSVGVSRKPHPDETSDGAGLHDLDSGPNGSPKSKKRNRTSNSGERDNGGLANKKAKGVDITKRTGSKGKENPSDADGTHPIPTSPGMRTPRSFSMNGRYELSSSGLSCQGRHSSLDAHRLSHSPITPSHSTSGDSRRSSSSSWESGARPCNDKDQLSAPLSHREPSTAEGIMGSRSLLSEALNSPQTPECQYRPASPSSHMRINGDNFTPRKLGDIYGKRLLQFPSGKQRDTTEDDMRTFGGLLEPPRRRGKDILDSYHSSDG